MNGLIYFEKDIDFVPIEDLKRHQKYLELLSVRIVDIIKSSHGRTLVLFTSKEEMKNTYILVHSEIENLGYTCYMHNGNASKTTADNFITNISSCLFSASYWEGIDVKGPSLSTVIIQKLPYSCPSPSFDYRNKVYQSIGFDNLNKMLMLTKLRQGAGRLIRDAKDRGIVAILDTRARKTELQEDILYNLPPFQIADTVADIKTFFDMDE
jgi:ATP-dependent DNA helicase DinG